MRNFFKSKKMWGYVNGTLVKLKNTNENYVVSINAWEVDNPKIITYMTILLSIP